MIITATIDTKSKKMEVNVDGKKMKNVSEATFMDFGGDMGGVEIRQSEWMDEEKVHRVTKIFANDEVKETIEPVEEGVSREDLAKVLLPR